jgi:hypothetical protein
MARFNDPFSPERQVDRERLLRYLGGELTPEEEHDVELHLERDPLLREALEGLHLPGATAGLNGMQRPAQQAWWRWGVLAVALLAGGLLLVPRNQAPTSIPGPSTSDPKPEEHGLPAAVESTLQVVDAELASLMDSVPAVPPRSEERFQRPIAPEASTERTSITRLSTQPTSLERPHAPAELKTTRTTRQSRQLVFLYGLKLVHPAELKGEGPVRLPSPGLPANAESPRNAAPEGNLQPYLDFMDAPMKALSQGADRAALDDLYFLLDQYPDDVNAQFYAGLACYRSGLFPRAQKLFHEAATNGVDSFDEEAAWYMALCTEQIEGSKAAAPAFTRIARAGGFYAGQAERKLHYTIPQ